jgi:hypothetical protein
MAKDGYRSIERLSLMDRKTVRRYVEVRSVWAVTA